MKKVVLGIFILVIVVAISCTKKPSLQNRIKFDFNWKFAYGHFPEAGQPHFDDAGWREVNLPHDFSIDHPFDSANVTGTGGGFAYSGIGWYRRHFILDHDTEESKYFVLFNGIYRNSEVWINGHYLGSRPYGYSSFFYDLTPYLTPAGQENVLAVKVNTSDQPNSRWYTGAGIYRHVWLVKTGKMHFAHWGVVARTQSVSRFRANIHVDISLINEYPDNENCRIITTLTGKDGKTASELSSDISVRAGDTVKIAQLLPVKNPKRWSVSNPYLYQLKVEVQSNQKVQDAYTTNFGIRTFHFDPDKGFFLNGKHVKLKGVNNHHDGGPLGAACFDYTYERQLKILKEMGCNALRMSHNPPAPELLDEADRQGFVVIDELFDEWTVGKTKGGYAPVFNRWYEKDVSNWIRRDRNHPSVIAWSIGNEVPEQLDSIKGPELVEKLVRSAKQFDTTRPFTSACNFIPQVNNNHFTQHLDIVGYNYWEALYQKDHKRFPNRIILGTETVKYPYQPGDCRQMHTYDEWLVGQTKDYVAGEFIWTGFDYLGEAGIGQGGTGCEPWNKWPGWPWRGSNSGMIDICGFKKPGFWFRKALWTDKPMVYIAVETDSSAKNTRRVPFWGWSKVLRHWNHDNEGDTLAVQVYTNVPDVELFLNGKSLGSQHWELSKEAFLTWNVPYHKGTLEAVGTLTGGKKVSCRVQTAGKPAEILLTTDRETITANQQDVAYVKAVLVDENGIPVPFADNLIEFEVTGEGQLAAVGNGDETSHTPFYGNKTEAWHGKCLAIVQSNDTKGHITLTARSKGLPEASMVIHTEKVHFAKR
jgi:beta-galactosidase